MTAPAPAPFAPPQVTPASRPKARVAGLYTTPDPLNSFETAPVASLELTFDGIPGERHEGPLRGADARTPWFTRGTPIRNSRQVSLLCPDELRAMAAGLDLPAIEPDWLGCNILVAGLPHFSFLPRGTRIFFPSGAVLAVEMQNAPCRFAGAAVMKRYPERAGLDTAFPAATKRLRGLVAWVEKPGTISATDEISLMVPEQWIWTREPASATSMSATLL
jgi:hypothetical protein